jgi:hypothetical protein
MARPVMKHLVESVKLTLDGVRETDGATALTLAQKAKSE